MLESKFQSEVVAAFESLGAKVFNVHGHGMQSAGWPDLQIYHPTWTGHLELKVNDNTCSTLQKFRIVDLNKMGTPAYVLRWRKEGLTLEDHECLVLAEVPMASWVKRIGNNRAHILFELVASVQ